MTQVHNRITLRVRAKKINTGALGPVLAPLKLSPKAVAQQIDKITDSYTGLKILIYLYYNPDRTFKVELAPQSFTTLLKASKKVKKLSELTHITEQDIKDILANAHHKISRNPENCIKTIKGTCKSAKLEVLNE